MKRKIRELWEGSYAKALGVKRSLHILLLIQVLILAAWYSSNLIFQLHRASAQDAMTDAFTVERIQKEMMERLQELQQISAFPVLRGSKDIAKDLYRSLAANSEQKRLNNTIVGEFEEEAAEIFNLNQNIARVAVVNLSGDGVILDRNTKGGTATRFRLDMDQPWVQEAIQLRGVASQALLLDDQEIGYKNSDRYIYCARAIVYAEQYRMTGLTIVAVEKSKLADLFLPQIDENSQKLILMVGGNRVLYGEADDQMITEVKVSDEVRTFQRTENGDQCRIVYSWPQEKDGCVILITPLKTLFQYWTANTGTFYFLIMLMIAIVIAFSYSIMQSINRPLQELMHSVDEYAKGNFSYKAPEGEQGEFTTLAKAMNHMSSSISRYIEEIYIRDLEMKENELRLLRSQVNPHFLYNALEAARMRAYCNEDTEVEEILMKLSSLMRYVLAKSTEPVTFRQELESIRAYLDICNVSAADPIRLEICVEPACQDAVMPRLTLQPLIENSIRHGFSKNHSGGCITILGYEEEDGCHLKIVDNGQGCSEDSLERLRHAFQCKKEPDETSRSSVIGLYNVHRRIQLLLGESYGIEIHSRTGCGFSVHIHIPMSEEKEQEE